MCRQSLIKVSEIFVDVAQVDEGVWVIRLSSGWCAGDLIKVSEIFVDVAQVDEGVWVIRFEL